MAGLVPEISPDDQRFAVLNALAIAMDIFKGPTCKEHRELLLRFQNSLASKNRLSDVVTIVDTVESLVRAALNSGAKISDSEVKKIKRNIAAGARASKDIDSPALDAKISESMRQVKLWTTKTPYYLAGEILPEVRRFIKERRLKNSSKGEISRDAVRKRIVRLQRD
jgi:hypothetical protein